MTGRSLLGRIKARLSPLASPDVVVPSRGLPHGPGGPIARGPLASAPARRFTPEPGGMPIVASSDPSLLPPLPIEHVDLEPAPRQEADTRPATVGWYLQLDDGRAIDVDELVLLGRNPQPAPHEEGAELVKIGTDAQSVSKTHLAAGVDDYGPWLVDRGSTNGTALVSTSGRLEPLLPGIRCRVSAGQRVSLGERWFTVERH